MQSSMVIFTFFVLNRKYLFLRKFGPKSQNCQFKLKFRRYLLLRLKLWSAKGASLHPVSWATAQQLVTCFSLMYVVDEFICLFLVLLTKWKRCANLKFLVLIREMREGGESKIFLYYPRGSGTSHQSFGERGRVFGVRGLFISD